jgi:DNA replication initiation complex subunit (GINS family)
MPKREENYSMDEIEGDVSHLVHLLDEIMSKILEVDHGPLSSSDSNYINRACAFCWVARDIAERIEAGFSSARRADRSPAKENAHA